MRLMFFLSVLTVAAGASSGCATMANGTHQSVIITSEPSGAVVTVLSGAPGGPQVVRSTPGVTPINLRLARRNRNLAIRLEKDGCAPAEIRLKREVSGWIAWNALSANPMAAQGLDSVSDYPAMALKGLAFTFGTDLLTGGAFKFPRSAHVKLEPAASLPGPRLCDSQPR